MPTLNQGQFIQSSISSVLDQNYPNIELIIQDGGSTDQTVELLTAISSEDSRVKWVSERDNGPADAIQRGFRKVRGEIVGWLNSDDLFERGAFGFIHEAFSQNPTWIMCYGNGTYVNTNGDFLRAYPTLRPEVGIEGFKSGCFICQPTVFFKTPMLSMLGDLDQSLKTSFDYDYWIRAFKLLPDRIGYIDRRLAKSRLHEDCITLRMRERVAIEGLALGQKHLNGAQTHWLVTYLDEIKQQHREDMSAFNDQVNSFLNKVRPYLDKQQLMSVGLTPALWRDGPKILPQ